MSALRGNKTALWWVAALAGLTLFCVTLGQGEWLEELREELRIRDGVVARLERRISELESERSAREASWKAERAKRWLERVAIPRDKALRIAQEDAAKFYRHSARNLATYDVEAALEIDGWHVDYVFKPGIVMAGGGLKYVIDPLDGKITSKIIEQ